MNPSVFLVVGTLDVGIYLIDVCLRFNLSCLDAYNYMYGEIRNSIMSCMRRCDLLTHTRSRRDWKGILVSTRREIGCW